MTNRLPKGFRRGHQENIACPHRDITCCDDCAAKHSDNIVESYGQHFWFSPAEKAQLAASRYRSDALQQDARIADAEHDLWLCFHRGARAIIRVPRESLALLLKAAQFDPARVLAGDPPQRAKQVDVTRSRLWELLTGKPLVKRDWNLA